MNTVQGQPQAVRPVSLEDLKVYRVKNPIKYAHKYGEIDFNDLPAGFESKLTAYKLAVAKERARRDLTGASQDLPAITPWSFFERPKQEKVVAAIVEPAQEGNTAGSTNTNGQN